MDLRGFALRTLFSTLTAVSFCFLGVPAGLAAPTLSSPEDARSAPICCSYFDPATGITNPCIAVGAACRATIVDLCTNDSLICKEIVGTGRGVCEQAVINQPDGTSCESMGPRPDCCHPKAKCDGKGKCTRGVATECPPKDSVPCYPYSCPCNVDPPTCKKGDYDASLCPRCTCGYTVQESLPADQGTALCKTVCADVGSTSSSYQISGYCACSGMPLQKCPGSAYGKPFNVIGTLPASCIPQLDCQVGAWEPAIVPCGTIITQTRQITQPQLGGGAACPALSQTVTGPPCTCQDQPQVTCSLDVPDNQGNEYVFCSTGTDQVWDDKVVRPGAPQRCSGSVGSAYYSCMMRILAADLCKKSTGATDHTVLSFSEKDTVSGSYRCVQWPLSNPTYCPEDCVVSGWSAAPVPCTPGTTYKSSPTISQEPSFGGEACPGTETKQCPTPPQDCVVSGWSAAPVPCTPGTTYTSSPTISQQPAFGGAACPGAKTEQCPICGNGKLEDGEQCDTGNGSSAGCIPGCKCVACKRECGGGGCKILARVKCYDRDPVTGEVKCDRITAWGSSAKYTDPSTGAVTNCADENCCPHNGTDTTNATRMAGVEVCLSLESACPSNPGRPTVPNSFRYSHSPNVSWAKCLISADSCMPGEKPACGNGRLEDNEECDGGPDCSAECTKTSGGGGGGGGDDGGGGGGGGGAQGCACSYNLTLGLTPDAANTECATTCRSIGATSAGAQLSAGYCSCGGVPYSTCPSQANGKALNTMVKSYNPECYPSDPCPIDTKGCINYCVSRGGRGDPICKSTWTGPSCGIKCVPPQSRPECPKPPSDVGFCDEKCNCLENGA